MSLSRRLQKLVHHLKPASHNTGSALQRCYSEMAVINKGLAAGGQGRSATSNITATVLGSSSFLARYFINALAHTGSQIVCPFRCDELDVQHLKVMGDLGQVVLYPNFDIRNEEMLDHAISKSNVVVNFIGAYRETWNYTFQDVHVDITRRIAEAVQRAGHVERFLHVSCLNATPDAPSRRLRTKAEGDRIVRELLPYSTIFKPAHVLGIEDKFSNVFASRGKRTPAIGLVNGGENLIQPVYVIDVAKAMVNSLKTYDTLGQEYYLGGPEVMTVREFARIVFETMREPYSPISVPYPVAKVAGQALDWLQRRTPPLPLISPQAYGAFQEEMTVNHVVPEGVKNITDLDVSPVSCISGSAIDHIRYLRAGGYELGTTSGSTSAEGVGFDRPDDRPANR